MPSGASKRDDGDRRGRAWIAGAGEMHPRAMARGGPPGAGRDRDEPRAVRPRAESGDSPRAGDPRRDRDRHGARAVLPGRRPATAHGGPRRAGRRPPQEPWRTGSGSSTAAQARMTSRLTLSVCVRGKSASGQRRQPAIRWWTASR